MDIKYWAPTINGYRSFLALSVKKIRDARKRKFYLLILKHKDFYNI
jgi:hypothetical protein